MNPPDTKRQKLDGTDNSKVETVELDMTQDAVPLEVQELTHIFMTYLDLPPAKTVYPI